MGRNARIKRERRAQRRSKLNKAWNIITNPKFIAEVRRAVIDSGAPHESSVCCTKVLCEIGQGMGIDIFPVPVEVTVYNPVFTNYIKNNGYNPSKEEIEELGENGGRFVILGRRRDVEQRGDKDKWGGHLVAIARTSKHQPVLIDTAIDLAHRSNADINIENPVLIQLTDNLKDFKFIASGISGTTNGDICFIYRSFPEDRDFEREAEWLADYGAKLHDSITPDSLSEAITTE